MRIQRDNVVFMNELDSILFLSESSLMLLDKNSIPITGIDCKDADECLDEFKKITGALDKGTKIYKIN